MANIYYLDSYGCAKNQVDAETMMASLDSAGWARSDDPDQAELIIINTCGFIESAKQESINAVLEYRKQYNGKKILMAGCLSQRYGNDLSSSLEEADFFFGNRDLSRTAEAAAAAMNGGARVLTPDADTNEVTATPSVTGDRPLLSLPGSAYVKITEGCDNRCAFCAIPGIRGPLRSRPMNEILDECKRLLDRGVRELCLIGQDIGSYGGDRGGPSALPALLEKISALEGRFWARLLYIHPDNFPRGVLDVMSRDSRILPYFDLPFQHGSAKILTAMNRRGNTNSYISLIQEIRTRLPDAVIRSTFLLGFPGETGEDFEALLDFQDRAELDWAGAFTFSREEDTPAYTMKNQVPKKTAARRKALVEERQIPISQKRMDRFVGRNMEALIEEAVDEAALEPSGSLEEGLYLGRLYCQAPEVDGAAVIRSEKPLVPGTLLPGRVFARAGFDLEWSPL
jgi:ribosomal protein S12 methylthiotransferase